MRLRLRSQNHHRAINISCFLSQENVRVPPGKIPAARTGRGGSTWGVSGEELGQALHALRQVCVGKGVGEPSASGRSERFTWDEGDLGLFQDDLG